MTTRPTDPVPNWADTGTRTVPSTSKRTAGWIFTDPPPFDFVNWFWGVVGDWVLHLSTSSSRFPSLEAAAKALAIGDTGIVDEWDGASFPGEELITVALGGVTGASAISVSGRSVCYAFDGTTLELKERSDLTTNAAAAAFVPTAATIRRTLNDGKFIAIAVGNFVELFDHDLGGAPIWNYDHGAQVNDIAMDGTHVYLVGDAGTGTHHARAILISTGLSAWDYDHQANLEAVATDGRRVFVAGAASGAASGATMRALNATNGNDAANEGGTAADTEDIAWDLVDANGATSRGQLATDGRGLLVVGMSAGTNRVQTRSTGDGTSIAFGALTGGSIPPVDVDQHYVYGMMTVGADQRILAFEKHTLALAWVSETADDYTLIATDGGALFATLDNSPPFQLAKIARGNDTRLWRRVDQADDYLRMRQQIVPVD